MSTSRICQRCGQPVSDFAPEGLCPNCLLESGAGEAATLPCEGGPDSSAWVAENCPNSQRAIGMVRYFGDYELLEEIARGGMGVVYKARQVSLNRTVAVKMILTGQLASAAEVQRFRHEAESAANLQHPNIVAIHEIGEYQGQQYFSMDFVEGRDLTELVRGGPLPPKRAAAYVKTIAEAIHYAHQKGVLHRDLKPSNVLVDSNDQPRVTDFGLAKRLTDSKLGTPKAELTLTGQVLGTPNYMPPEQARGRRNEIGPYSDVYSLGGILFFLLTGRPPFLGETLEETLSQLLHSEPISPRLFAPTMPRDLETITLKCLQKEPTRRYESAQELACELGRFLRGEPIQARPASVSQRVIKWIKRRPAIAALLTTLAFVLIGGVSGIIWQWRKTETARRTHEYESYVAKVGLAAAKIEASAFSPAEELLATCPPHLRHWEWGRLKALCRPDHRTLTMSSWRNWTRTDGEGIPAVGFSRDGTIVVSGKISSGWRSLMAWEVSTGKLICRNDSGPDPLNGIVFATTNNWVMTDSGAACDPRMIGPPVRSFGIGRPFATRTSADGERVLLIHDDHLTKGILWDIKSGQQISSLLLASNRVIFSFLALSPRGDRLITEQTNTGASPGQSALLAQSGGTSDARLTVTKVWDTQSGRELCLLNSAPGMLRSAAFSPDAKLVFTVRTNTITESGRERPNVAFGLWDATTGRKLPQLDGAMIDLPAFSPNGQWLLARHWSQPNVASIWEVATGRKLASFVGHTNTVLCLAFSRDGTRVVTGGADGTARVWNAATGEETRVCIGSGKAVQAAAFSPNGEQIVTESTDNTITIWEVTPSQVTARLRGHGGWFFPDSSRVLTLVGGTVNDASADTAYRVWEVPSGKLLLTVAYPGLVTSMLPFDGQRIYAVCSSGDPFTNNVARVLDGNTGRELFVLRRPALWRFSPDGRRVLALNGGSFARWDSTEEEKRQCLPRLWEIETGREILLIGRTNNFNEGAFSEDGRRVALVASELIDGVWQSSVCLWEVSTGRLIATSPAVTNVDFPSSTVPNRSTRFLSGDRFFLGQGSSSNHRSVVLLWHPVAQQPPVLLNGFFLGSSPQDDRLLMGHGVQAPGLWSSASRKQLCLFKGHAQEVRVGAFFPDGKRVLTASTDQTVKLWDADTGRELLTFAQGEEIISMAVSPNGRHVLTGSADGTATLWTAAEWSVTETRAAQ